MDITITKSKNKNKKYDAIIDGKKKVSFGDNRYEDFTQHKDDKRKELYIKRHSNEDHSKSNIASPAFMSRWILWHKPTLKGSIDDINKKYKDVNVKLKT
jgi:hypothetical protein